MNKKVKNFSLLILITMLIGVSGGIIGALFAHSIHFVTNLRMQNGFLIFLLPLGAIATVALYKILGTQNISTISVFDAVSGTKEIPSSITPAVFIASLFTHLLGGSAGREGASLQIGGGISALFFKAFKLPEQYKKVLFLSGMASVFSAVFGTPFTAAIFVFEVIKQLKSVYKSILLVLCSSLIGYFIATILKVPFESFTLPNFNFSLSDLSKVILLSGFCGIISYLFCILLSYSKKLFHLINNPYIRGVIGSVLIIAIALLIASRDFNGAGTHIIEHAIEGAEIKPYAFAIKILLTCITIGAGFKGGEIVPAFFIGATFGSTLSAVLGLPLPLGAAIGLIILFMGATKCPIASFILSVELFNFRSIFIFYIFISIIIGFVFSGNSSLYNNPTFLKEKHE